jgi:hypothetical protein
MNRRRRAIQGLPVRFKKLFPLGSAGAPQTPEFEFELTARDSKSIFEDCCAFHFPFVSAACLRRAADLPTGARPDTRELWPFISMSHV